MSESQILLLIAGIIVAIGVVASFGLLLILPVLVLLLYCGKGL